MSERDHHSIPHRCPEDCPPFTAYETAPAAPGVCGAIGPGDTCTYAPVHAGPHSWAEVPHVTAHINTTLEQIDQLMARAGVVPPHDYDPATTPTTDEVRVTAASGAVKADGGKRRLDLLPVGPLLDIADVLTFGANKYADRNWERGFPFSRPYAAALRHMLAWWSGETNDPETGLNHLAHAATNIMFLLEYAHTGAGEDDRP